MKNKFIKILTLLVATTALFSGCQNRKDDISNNFGYLDIEMKTDMTTVIAKTKADADARIYKVEIVSQTDNSQEPIVFENHTTMPQRITLPYGKYKVVATSGDTEVVGMDAPYFVGETEVTIDAYATKTIAITAKLANVKISVSVDKKIIDNFKTYTLVITQNERSFTISDFSKSAYVKAGEPFAWKLQLTNNQNESYEIGDQVSQTEAREHYKFDFKVTEMTDPTMGAGGLTLKISTDLDVTEHDFMLEYNKFPMPVYTARENCFKLGETIFVNELTRGKIAIVDIEALAGIRNLSVRHMSDALTKLGVPSFVELSNSTTENRNALSAIGIEWSQLVVDQTKCFIDFSKLCNTAPLGMYEFTIQVEDKESKLIEQKVSVYVLPDQDHMPVDAQPWAKYAVFNGKWYTSEKPSDLTFEYRIEGQSEWTAVDQSLITVDQANKTISAKVGGLIPLSNYQYRTKASGTKEAAIMSFSTEDAPVMPNMDFEKGYTDGVFYPNASGGNSFWATGNLGTNMAGKGSVTTQTDDAVKGKAIKMYSVGGVMVVDHAAGNIFTGDFTKPSISMDPGVMKANAKFGRPYTGRPAGLKGYYKYKSTTITHDKYNVDGGIHKNKPDQCHIYVSLEYWGAATSRPSSPVVIGYGEFASEQNATEYTEFKFNINYNRTDVKPTHIVLVATSSRWGGDFCGGNGSELFVDEFEFLWE